MTDDAPEIIEILDDDTSAFGERPTSTAVHDTGGPRWIGPVAAVALVGVIVYGIATSGSSPGPTNVAPASSTTAATATTRPATSVVSGPPRLPYYTAEPPRGFKVLQAVENTYPEGSAFGDNHYVLWAMPGASATSGSWFSVNYYLGQAEIWAPEAYRLQTGRGDISISHSPSGRTSLQYSTNSAATFTVNAVGWSDDDLISLAESARVDPDTGNIFFPGSTHATGFELISTVEPWLAVNGAATEQVFYLRDADSQSIGLNVSPLPDLNGEDVAAARQVALRFLLDHQTYFTVDSRPAVAGTIADQPISSLATWVVDDHMITVSGNLPVSDLIAVARTVHTVSANEWDGMRFQAVRNSSEPGRGNYSSTTPLPVSFGTDGAGNSWTIDVSVGTYGTLQQLDWRWGNTGFATSIEATPQIHTFVTNTRTYVFADLPRAVASTAELHITLAELDPVVVPFTDTDPALDRTFAAYAFSEPGQYTAEIVGPDGTVLAGWPSS